jgi:hypothetical protein
LLLCSRDSEEEVAQAREFAAMLLIPQDGRQDSVLEIMFQVHARFYFFLFLFRFLCAQCVLIYVVFLIFNTVPCLQNVILQMISVYPDLLNDQAPPPIAADRFTELPTISVDQPLLGNFFRGFGSVKN